MYLSGHGIKLTGCEILLSLSVLNEFTYCKQNRAKRYPSGGALKKAVVLTSENSKRSFRGQAQFS